MAVEWIKSHWLLAKTGDKSARRKLLGLAIVSVVTLALLISGQTESKPITVKTNKNPLDLVSSAEGFVHLTGAIKHPGVYPITPRMRLFEAVALAGGFTKKADRDSVNLARTLTDGEQVIIATSGQVELNDGLIHLNSATASDFDKLPGIGPTLSARIIDWRNANGTFKSIEDLRKIGGIGDKLFAGLKPLVVL